MFAKNSKKQSFFVITKPLPTLFISTLSLLIFTYWPIYNIYLFLLLAIIMQLDRLISFQFTQTPNLSIEQQVYLLFTFGPSLYFKQSETHNF